MLNLVINRAEKDLKDHLSVVDTWPELLNGLNQKHLIMSPFCGDKLCEENIKKDSAQLVFSPTLSILCIKLLINSDIINVKRSSG